MRLVETVQGIRSMMELLKDSLDAIARSNEMRKAQNMAVDETVKINEDIAERILQENSDFTNITEMVQGNTKDIIVLTEQVDHINGMVQELEKLLDT